jgi:hypothetical protein
LRGNAQTKLSEQGSNGNGSPGWLTVLPVGTSWSASTRFPTTKAISEESGPCAHEFEVNPDLTFDVALRTRPSEALAIIDPHHGPARCLQRLGELEDRTQQPAATRPSPALSGC